jgi:hypothetical protein
LTAAENANAAQASLTRCFCIIWRVAHDNDFLLVYAGQKANRSLENVRMRFRRLGIVRSRFLLDDVLDAAADIVAVMDELDIERAHYWGVGALGWSKLR